MCIASPLAVEVASERSLDFFPYLWIANDLAIIAASAGVMLTLFHGRAPEKPPADEWTRRPPAQSAGVALEDLLVVLARRLGRECAAP